ncbi:cytochrome c biogenesis protein [bacterium]|nr:cytochrome c biogenesis protein [bacterium]
MQFTNVTIFCFFASYFCALILELTQFLKVSKVVRWSSFALAFAGFVAQTIYLVERSRHSDLPPLLGSTHDWLLVSAWLSIVFYLGAKVWDQSLSIGLFVLPVVLLLIGASRFVSDQPNPRVTIAYWWTMVHASFWMLGILGVILAFVMSLMYLLQHYRLKHKKAPLPALRMLSLERLSRMNWWLIVSSVPLLTLGMVTGLWMSYLRAGSAEPVDLAQLDFVMFALVWVGMTFLFGWLLVSRKATGRLVAWRTILACAFLLVTILAIEFLSADTIHGPEKQTPQASMNHQVASNHFGAIS